jgi:hypothetical protein
MIFFKKVKLDEKVVPNFQTCSKKMVDIEVDLSSFSYGQ